MTSWFDKLNEIGFDSVDHELFVSPFVDSDVYEFADLVRNGRVREYYDAADSVDLCGINFAIIGVDHDKVYNNPMAYTVTLMGTTLLSTQPLHHRDRCEAGWFALDIRNWLEEYFESLPESLKPYIKSTEKATHNHAGGINITRDKLFLPSASELFGVESWNYNDGEQYEAFRYRENRIRRDADGNPRWYWTRSVVKDTSTSFCSVGSSGRAGSSNASYTTIRVPLCFLFSPES